MQDVANPLIILQNYLNRFAACKRSLNLRGGRNLGKITGKISRPQFNLSLLRSLASLRRKWERLKAGESNGKLPPKTCPGCSVPEPDRSQDWSLPTRPLRLNTNEWMIMIWCLLTRWSVVLRCTLFAVVNARWATSNQKLLVLEPQWIKCTERAKQLLIPRVYSLRGIRAYDELQIAVNEVGQVK